MGRLIDADALKAYIDAQKGRPFIGCTVGEALKIMTDEQPTIEPEQRKGKWIDITNYESLEEEYKCSVCGYELYYSYPTKFCPNCGADMRGEKDAVD